MVGRRRLKRHPPPRPFRPSRLSRLSQARFQAILQGKLQAKFQAKCLDKLSSSFRDLERRPLRVIIVRPRQARARVKAATTQASRMLPITAGVIPFTPSTGRMQQNAPQPRSSLKSQEASVVAWTTALLPRLHSLPEHPSSPQHPRPRFSMNPLDAVAALITRTTTCLPR